jgi:hypothetical protein
MVGDAANGFVGEGLRMRRGLLDPSLDRRANLA